MHRDLADSPTISDGRDRRPTRLRQALDAVEQVPALGRILTGIRATSWPVVLAIVWGAIALPYVAVGPNDFEEYFTSVTSTSLAVQALLHGAWPFWNLDLGLGMPQPLRFHFITH